MVYLEKFAKLELGLLSDDVHYEECIDLWLFSSYVCPNEKPKLHTFVP
jgi:hypothetical protein